VHRELFVIRLYFTDELRAEEAVDQKRNGKKN
jgi:hypothetical protein